MPFRLRDDQSANPCRMYSVEMEHACSDTMLTQEDTHHRKPHEYANVIQRQRESERALRKTQYLESGRFGGYEFARKNEVRDTRSASPSLQLVPRPP